MNHDLYEPREDSELLALFVKRYAKGRVLDVGTGTGIQGIAALESDEVTHVICVDINPAAVKHVRERIATEHLKKIEVRESDLFNAIKKEELFETIICNPPYLPDEEKDENPALYGGPQGYEFIEQFLTQAKQHLAPQGSILLLFSSLSNKERVDHIIKQLGCHFEQLVMEAHFFEQLYVYRIWVS